MSCSGSSGLYSGESSPVSVSERRASFGKVGMRWQAGSFPRELPSHMLGVVRPPRFDMDMWLLLLPPLLLIQLDSCSAYEGKKRPTGPVFQTLLDNGVKKITTILRKAQQQQGLSSSNWRIVNRRSSFCAFLRTYVRGGPHRCVYVEKKRTWKSEGSLY